MKQVKLIQTIILSSVLFLGMNMSCNQSSNKKKDMKEINQWIEQGNWKEGLVPSLHMSVNSKMFFQQYQANPVLWDNVFKFFKETDLDTLAIGKHLIDGDNAFAAISEYQTKELEDAKWESHKKYIDLQYVIGGEEKIGVMSLKKAQGASAYNEDKDLIFYGDGEGDYYEANPGTFFLFFPEDVHRPSILINEPKPVKKMVIKIALAE